MDGHDVCVKRKNSLNSTFTVLNTILPRDVRPMHKRGLRRHTVSVRLSVRPSVMFLHSVETNKHIFKMFSPLGSHHTILVFPYQTSWQYSDGDPVTGRRMEV